MKGECHRAVPLCTGRAHRQFSGCMMCIRCLGLLSSAPLPAQGFALSYLTRSSFADNAEGGKRRHVLEGRVPVRTSNNASFNRLFIEKVFDDTPRLVTGNSNLITEPNAQLRVLVCSPSLQRPSRFQAARQSPCSTKESTAPAFCSAWPEPKE